MTTDAPTTDAPAAETPPAETRGATMIPKARFDQVYEERKALAAERDALAAKVAELAPVAERLGALDADLTDSRALWQLGANDPAAVAVARALHAQLPAEDRPALPDWIKGQVESGQFARGLGEFFARPAATPATPAPAPRQPAAPAPAPTPANARALDEAMVRMQRNPGDPAAAEHLRAVMRSMGISR